MGTAREASEEQAPRALDLARALRRAGRLRDALGLLDTTLGQAALQAPITVELAEEVGWLHLERGGIRLDRGDLEGADADASAALGHFTAAQQRAGAGFAALLSGDIAAAAGGRDAAGRWWQSALALADVAGNGALAARALAALLATGHAEDAGLTADEIALAARRRLEAAAADALGDDDPRVARAEAQTRAAEASLALCACHDAIARGDLSEARLLLPEVVAAARDLDDAGLEVQALRLDADLARRGGDARAAVASLARASALCRSAGLLRLLAVVRSERILALCDDGRDAEAFELAADGPQPGESADAAAGLPAPHAAGLEAFAVLSLRAGQLAAARRAIDEALALREALGDGAALGRCRALALEVVAAEGDAPRRLTLAEALLADSTAPADARVAAALHADAADEALGVQRGPGAAARRNRLLDARRFAEGAALPTRIALEEARAIAAARAGDDDDAEAALAEAERLAAGAPMLRTRARHAARTLSVRALQGRATDVVQQAQAALTLAHEARDLVAQRTALLATGEALASLGRLDEAALAYGHAHDAGGGAEALLGQAAVQARSGRPLEAAALYERSFDAARRLGAPALQARALRGLAATRPAEAERALAAAAALGGSEGALAALDAMRLRGSVDGLDALLAEAGDDDAVALEAAILRASSAARDATGDPAAAAALGRALRSEEARARRIGGRALGAWALLTGQLEIVGGDGSAGGALLAEAVVLAAREGGAAAATARAVAERLLGAATADTPAP
ncbi:MAG: hypothetical protein RIT45_797 [Pseudomonadota bacterium]